VSLEVPQVYQGQQTVDASKKDKLVQIITHDQRTRVCLNGDSNKEKGFFFTGESR
jgi:hypothetical protein